VIDETIRRFALPEGAIKDAIAGFLYFPQHGMKKNKSDETELKYAKDDVEVNLIFPKSKP
jgi:hypothetical protein